MKDTCVIISDLVAHKVCGETVIRRYNRYGFHNGANVLVVRNNYLYQSTVCAEFATFAKDLWQREKFLAKAMICIRQARAVEDIMMRCGYRGNEQMTKKELENMILDTVNLAKSSLLDAMREDELEAGYINELADFAAILKSQTEKLKNGEYDK